VASTDLETAYTVKAPRSPPSTVQQHVLVSLFPIESSLQNDSFADQVASKPANRFFDRAGAVARFRLQISELNELCDDRRRCSRPLETTRTASATRQLFEERIAIWAAEKPR
jgi:hypothetical protein